MYVPVYSSTSVGGISYVRMPQSPYLSPPLFYCFKYILLDHHSRIENKYLYHTNSKEQSIRQCETSSRCSNMRIRICKRQRVNNQHLPYICFWHTTYIHHPHLLFHCFISFFALSHCSIPNGSRCNGGRDITLTRTPWLIVECCNVFTSTNYNTFAIALLYVTIVLSA